MKIRLSHSALSKLTQCERMFQLDRLLVGAPEREEYPATILGKSYGAGVQDYMVHQDIDKAVFECYKNYYPVKEDDKRTEEVAITLLLSSQSAMDNILMDWEVAYFQDKPAIELSFRLNIDETFYYVGYVDLILKNKYTGQYAITEVKTTTIGLLDIAPLYQNSGQALGYSIILDKIVGENQASYDVLYLAAQMKRNPFESTIHTLPYTKTIQDRLNWFISLQLDVNRLHEMLDNNVFPMRGQNCLQYMRPCKHFGTCSLHGLDTYKPYEEDAVDYQFTYKLDEVIQDHLNRLED